MKLDMLNNAIEASGLKKKAIAEFMGITPHSLKLKLSGEREFRLSEVDRLSQVLYLSVGDIMAIFFDG